MRPGTSRVSCICRRKAGATEMPAAFNLRWGNTTMPGLASPWFSGAARRGFIRGPPKRPDRGGAYPNDSEQRDAKNQSVFHAEFLNLRTAKRKNPRAPSQTAELHNIRAWQEQRPRFPNQPWESWQAWERRRLAERKAGKRAGFACANNVVRKDGSREWESFGLSSEAARRGKWPQAPSSKRWRPNSFNCAAARPSTVSSETSTSKASSGSRF